MSSRLQASNRKPTRERSRPDCGRRRAVLVAGVLAVCASLGCDRNIEPYQAGEEPREPDLARIFPGPPAGEMSAGATQAGSGDAAGDSSGQAGRAAFPPSRTEAAGGPATDPADGTPAGGDAMAAASAGPIAGQIEIAPALAGQQPEGAILFVIARPVGAVGGPPLAVLRIPQPEFPVAFEIGQGDVMIPSMRFEGPISLTARLDTDGNAMTRAETDLSSAAAPPVEPGATGVTLVLAQKG